MKPIPALSAGSLTRRSKYGCSWYFLGIFIALALLLLVGWVLFSPFYPRQALKATLTGHRGWIPCVAIAPNGTTFATGGEDHTVRLWELATGKERAVLRGHTDTVWAVSFSPDNRLLASASEDGSVRIWATGTGRQRAALLGHAGLDDRGKPMSAYAVTFSPDGRCLASGGADQTVRLWEVATGKERAVLHHTSSVLSLAITSDGKWLATRTLTGAVTVWDLLTGKYVRDFGEERGRKFNVLLLGADDQTLATNLDSEEKVQLWDLTTGRQRTALKADLNWGDSPVHPIAVSPDGQLLVATTLGGARMLFWDTGSGQHIGTIHFPPAYALAFSPDGAILISTHEDGAVRLWDLNKLVPRK